jgi:8-oxo-dGTP pyrophosphatase MutT (NUDIX family)
MELWDIYDKDKKRTGRTMKRDDWHMKEGDYHLSVLGVIMRPDGKFLITRRAEDKGWAPGWWEVSGGAALAGEDSFDAVLREINEETGLDVSGCEGGLLFSYHRENPGDNYFVDVYRFLVDFTEEDVILQEEETSGYMIADLKQIDVLGNQGIFLHYNSIKGAFVI